MRSIVSAFVQRNTPHMMLCGDNIQLMMTNVLDVVVDIMDYLQWQTVVIVRDTSSGNGLIIIF